MDGGATGSNTSADLRVDGLTVFVRGLEIQAGIGVYDHEHGRLQPLIIDVTLELAPAVVESLADTINYEVVTLVTARVPRIGLDPTHESH